jgi:hypothetical protein
MENHKNRKKKINLEDLDKKNIYSVPEAYFDKLSYSIQNRIHEKEVSWFEKLKTSPIKYAIPAFSILLVLTFYFFLRPSVKQVAVNNQPVIKDSLKKEIFKQDEKITIISPEKDNGNKKREGVKIKDPAMKEVPLPNENNLPVENNITAPEPIKTAQEYLAGVSKEDIKMYLEMNDMSESQMEEIILEN